MPYKNPDEQRRYQRERWARIRAEYFTGKVCAACGSEDRLEVDHIDPGKKISHKIWSWSTSRREVELSKCQVLCRPCHWEKTKLDFGWDGGCGTPRGYSKGCRCDRCRSAHAEAMRKWRRRSAPAFQNERN